MNKELEEAQTFFTNVVVNVIEKMRQEFVQEGVSEEILGRVKEVGSLLFPQVLIHCRIGISTTKR
jgi:hypothetical protein